MPDIINLKEYLDQIDSLLDERRYDEAAFHARHILQQQPKNILAYRRLGRALLSQDKWDEAGEVLRRVLSVVPDDQAAHRGLSRVYHQGKKASQAIWHLERAWEHDPNNAQLSEELRELYYFYHKVEDARLQLTAGAVARQYVRNRLFEQAIALLTNTLKEAKDRVDLRLLLARTQREAGKVVEAAETALDIITVLPDCLEANYILAELWLTNQRPSDAQRYLSRIEPVDPYLARRLVSGKAVDEDSVQFEFADYQASASREMSDAPPDWLNDLGGGDDFMTDESAADEDDFTFLFAEDVEEEQPDFDALLGDDADETPIAEDDDDWLAQLDSDTDLDSLLAEIESEETGGKSLGLTGILAALEETKEEESAIEADEDFDLESMFLESDDDNATVQVDMDEDDDLAWLTQPIEADEESEPDSDPNDPFAWMNQHGVQFVENADDIPTRLDQFAADEDAELEAFVSKEQDPLAWLKASGVDVVEEEEDELARAFDADDDDNPMAWLRDSGVEIEPEEAQPNNAISDADFEAFLGELPTTEADAIDFTDSELLDEMLAMEALAQDTQEDKPMSDRDADEFNWLDDDSQDDSEETNLPDWLMGEQSDADQPDWLVNEDSPTEEGEPFEALNPSSWTMPDTDTVDDGEAPDWLTASAPQASTEEDEDDFAFMADEEAEETPDWLLGGSTDEAEPEAETPSWLAGIAGGSASAQPQYEAEEDEEEAPDWLYGTEEAEPEEEASSWLAGIAGGNLGTTDESLYAVNEEESAEEETPSWLSGTSYDEEDAEATPGWLMGGADEAEEATPDWLVGAVDNVQSEPDFEAEDDEEAFSFMPEAESGTPDWLTSDQEESAEETPSWLSGTSYEEEFAEEAETPAWLLGTTDEVESDEEEFAEEANIPDWLVGAAPVTAQPIAAQPGDDLDFLMDVEDEMDAEDDSEEAIIPDWLAGASLTEDEEDFEEEAIFDFSSELEEEESTPDWLSAFGVEASDKEPEQAPMTSALPTTGSLDWVAEGNDEEVFAVDDEFAPDWLDEVEEGDTSDIVGVVAEGEANWLDDLDEEDEFTEEPIGEFDWLDALQEPEELVTEDAYEEEFDFLEELDVDEGDFEFEEEEGADLPTFETEVVRDGEVAPEPARNAPDWLNAMVPGFDVDYSAEEDAQVESAFLTEAHHQAAARAGASVEFNWLDQIVEAERYQRPEISPDNLPGVGGSPEPARPAVQTPSPQTVGSRRFTFSRPPAALRNLNAQTSAMSPAPIQEAEPTDINDLPDWLTSARVDIPELAEDDFFSDDALHDDTDLFGDELFAGKPDDDLNFDDDLFSDNLFDDDDDLFKDK